jgi:hypothetical protein
VNVLHRRRLAAKVSGQPGEAQHIERCLTLVDGDSLLRCDLSTLQGATIIRPTGVLTVHTYPLLRDAMLKCAADQPCAVIIDLDALEITHDYLTSVFVTVWLRISAVSLVIVAGPAHTASIHHGPVHRFLTVRPTVLDALKQLDEPAPRQRTELWLPPSALSVRSAQRFVTDTCHNWQIDTLIPHATAVASELVANTAQHTSSPARLRLELRRLRLTVAVADDDPQPVTMRRPANEASEPRKLSAPRHTASNVSCKISSATIRSPASRNRKPNRPSACRRYNSVNASASPRPIRAINTWSRSRPGSMAGRSHASATTSDTVSAPLVIADW